MGAMGVDDRRKHSWPEVVGWNVLVAGAKIERDRPDIHRLELHHVGDTLLPGHDSHRVRLFLKPGTAIIAKTPVVG
jgi:hypothetical protein